MQGSAIGVLTNGKYTSYFNSYGDNLSHIYGVNICKYHHTFEDYGIKNSVLNLENNEEIICGRFQNMPKYCFHTRHL